jgi:hypothetical protein
MAARLASNFAAGPVRCSRSARVSCGQRMRGAASATVATTRQLARTVATNCSCSTSLRFSTWMTSTGSAGSQETERQTCTAGWGRAGAAGSNPGSHREGAVGRAIGVFSKKNGEHSDPIGEAGSPGGMGKKTVVDDRLAKARRTRLRRASWRNRHIAYEAASAKGLETSRRALAGAGLSSAWCAEPGGSRRTLPQQDAGNDRNARGDSGALERARVGRSQMP